MNRHFGDISATVEAGCHAVVLIDSAGWHKSRDLDIPDHPCVPHLPPCSPALNPTKNAFEYLKSSHLACRVFQIVQDV